MAVAHGLYSEAGRVEIAENCSHCGECAKICPAEVLHMVDGQLQVSEESPFGCIACGHCMMVCPGGSIRVSGRGLSVEDLIDLPAKESLATAEQLEALLRSRRSVRRFSPKEVEPELIERILTMASSAPMGIPPWDVGCLVINGREKVAELSSEVAAGYEKFLKIFKPWLLAAMRPFVRKRTYEQFKSFIRPLAVTYVEAHRQGRDVVFWDAPAVILFHHSPYADPADASIACTYAMLAAESLGLGSTVIGGACPIIQRNKKLCLELGIPPENTPAIALVIGYPATHFRRGVRRRFAWVNELN